MFDHNAIPGARVLLLAGVIVSGILVSPAAAQSEQPTAPPVRYHRQPNRFSKRATEYYGLIWGIESPSVKAVESGEIIRFTYRVLDGDKATALNDKKSEPSLIDEQAGVRLVVPALEQVGQLRQSGTPQAGRSYWMAFSNPRRSVKPGDRVTVVIGRFRAEGLVVE